MTVEFVVISLGALLLLTGIIGGGFEIRELKIPQVGRIARILSTVVGIMLMLTGIGMAAQPSSTDSPPTVSQDQPATAFTIFDRLGENQLSEQATILVDGKIVGNLTVNSDFPDAQTTVTVPQPGQHSYTVEASANFYDPETGKPFFYTGAGQGMIQVHDGANFRLARSVSGNSWIVSLVES